MGKSRLFVFKLKEVVYTAIFVILAIVLIVLLISRFGDGGNKDSDGTSSTVSYNPGIYTTQLSLGDTSLNIEVTVDKNHVKSVNINNLTESITTVYPLIEPSVTSIEAQLQQGVSIDSIKISDESRYTQTLLIQSINDCLKKAAE